MRSSVIFVNEDENKNERTNVICKTYSVSRKEDQKVFPT